MKKLKLIITFILLVSLFLGVVACTPAEESKAESTGDVSVDVSDAVSEAVSGDDVLNTGATAEEITEISKVKLNENQVILRFQSGKYYIFDKTQDDRKLVFINIKTLSGYEFETEYRVKYGYGFSNFDISYEQFALQKEEIIKSFRTNKCVDFMKSINNKENIYIKEDYIFNYGIKEHLSTGHFFVFPAYLTEEELSEYKKLYMVQTILTWDECLQEDSTGNFWNYVQYLPM